MTDKQIIIDNIDVSGCTYSQIGIDGKCYCEQDLYDDDTPVFTCDECPNCNFKQLTRKTQECEQAEQKLERIKEIAEKYVNNCNFSWRCEECSYECYSQQIIQKCEEVNK